MTEMYKTKILAKASLTETPPEEQIKAVATKLAERGKFPVNIVSQPDVLALQAVMLTTGRPGNLNDDVILNEEILPVVHTAALKPLNVEHSKLVIGCIFDAFAIDKKTGQVVKSNEECEDDMTKEEYKTHIDELKSRVDNLPENLDIITNQIIWSLHFPEVAAAVKSGAIKGELFVSMELWFSDYDYLVGNRVVRKTPETAAILDAKLRIKGGDGLMGLEKVKRVPRQVLVAGIAIVDKPANPQSFILDVMDRHDLKDQQEMEDEEHEEEEVECKSVVASLLDANTLCILPRLNDDGETDKTSVADDVGRSDTSLGSDAKPEAEVAKVDEVVIQSEDYMETNEKKVIELIEKNAVLQKQFDDAQNALAAASKVSEDLQAKHDELSKKLEDAEKQIKQHETELAVKVEAVKALETSQASFKKELDAAQATLKKIEEERKLEARKTVLAGIGISAERVVKVLAKTQAMTDEEFNAEVADLKAFMGEFVKPEQPKAETAETSKATIEVATEEKLEEVLDELEEEETPAAKVVAKATVEADETVDLGNRLALAMAKSLGIDLEAK
jgi:hypothetical protein